MNEIYNDWLVRSSRQPWVLGGGISYPNKTFFTHPVAPNYPKESLDNAWRCLADTVQVLKHHRIPAARLRWVYEHCHLHCAIRPDGIILALFTARKAVDEVEVDRLLSEFQLLEG